MSEATPVYDHCDGSYCYRGFRIRICGDGPALALVRDPMAPQRRFEPVVRVGAKEALLAVVVLLDTYCRDEATVTAAQLMS